MTETRDLEHFLPPEDPLDMPYQVIERHREAHRTWLDLLRQLVVRRESHE